MEDTLTSGYAHALALESERRRLERLILTAATEPGSRRRRDVSGLADEFWRVDALLRELRGMLEQLRLQHRTLVRAQANGLA